MARRAFTLGCFGAAVAVCGLGAARAAGDRPVEWRIRTGSDLVGEQFHLIETDTLDLNSEIRTQLQARWTYSGRRENGAWRDVVFDSRLGVGTQALRHDFSAEASWLPGRSWTVNLRGQSFARYYLDSAGGIRSNFFQGRLQATAEHPLIGEGSSWGVDQGIEGTLYGTRSPVFLSGLRHWHGLVAEGQWGLDLYGGRLVFEHERIPDSTALDYLGLAGECYGTASSALAFDLGGDANFSARRYRDRAVHPDQLAGTAHLRAGWHLLPNWSIEFDPSATVMRYSPADSIYYSFRRLGPAVSLIWWPNWGSVRAGPTAEWQRSPTYRGEDHTDLGIMAELNLLSLRRGLFDLVTEVGHRTYRFPAEALFSDHRYWDTTLLVTTYLPWKLQLDAFVVYRLERHSAARDNTQSLLLTIDLSRPLGD